MKELDLKFVRSHFPAFSVPEFQGMSFFENAGGSFPAANVVSRLSRFYNTRKVQPYAHYRASFLAGQEMDEARKKVAQLLNVSQTTLHFGPSTSQNTFVLSQAFRQLSTKRNSIIVTNQDHEANSGSWRRLEADGFEIREWAVDPKTGSLNMEDLKLLLDDDVLLMAFPHCSNILGEVNPVSEICKLANSWGAFTCVDGVSFAPHCFPDLSRLGADIYLFSSYKTYGPHLGVMYIHAALNELLPNQGHFFNSESAVKRFTPAGPDHAQIAALAGVADYFDSLFNHHFDSTSDNVHPPSKVFELQNYHEASLLTPLIEFLKTRDDLRILGPTEVHDRVSTVAIDLKERSPEVAVELAKDGIMADSGDFYAVRLLEALGVDLNYGVLRLSFVHYTSDEDVNKLINSLEKNL